MPKPLTIQTYTYDELDPKAQEYARDSYSRMVAETWDHESIYEDFKRIAVILGVQLDTRTSQPARKGEIPEAKIWYSGFYSQGDGACFEGQYRYGADSVAQIKQYAPQDTTLHQIAEDLARVQHSYCYLVSATITHEGYYYHAYSTRIDVATDTRRPIVDADVEAIRDALRALMHWLFNALRTEFEYQTTNKDALEDGIRGNDLTFTKDGKRSVTL
jgi:hypothetical protein